MSNPLFNLLGGNNNLGNMAGMISQFQQFKNSFQGDPRQQIQMLLNSGKISQQQYNQAVQQAKMLQELLNKM